MSPLLADWAQLDALEAQVAQMRAQLEASPCPEGWSRHDLFVSGRDCAVPELAARVLVGGFGALVMTGSFFAFAGAHTLIRKGRMQLSHAMRMHAMGGLLLGLMHLWVAVGGQQQAHLHKAAITSFAIVGSCFYVEGLRSLTIDVFFAGAIDICFALRPKRATRVKQATWVFFTGLQLVCSVLFAHGLVQIAAHPRGAPSNTHAILEFVIPVSVMLFCSAAAMLCASRLARTALAAVPDKSETKMLRRRLEKLKNSAGVQTALPAAYSATCFMAIALVPPLRRLAGTASAASLLLWTLGAIFRIRSVVVASKHRRRIAATADAAKAPELGLEKRRRLSQVERAGVDQEGLGCAGVQERGVSLAFLQRFIAEKGIGFRTTTAEVCERIVKPITSGAQCAYHELLRGEPGHSGRSHYFISHSWAYRFMDLVLAIENFEAQLMPKSTRYYWFDIFVLNQHSTDEIGGELLGNLRRSIETPGKLLLLLDSWRDPAPLARCWCLFELYTAIQCGADITMCLGRDEEQTFTSNLDANSHELELLIYELDAEEAEATVVADREMIFGRIREEIGFDAFNAALRASLRSALERTVMAARNPFRRTAISSRRTTPRRTPHRGTPRRLETPSQSGRRLTTVQPSTTIEGL